MRAAPAPPAALGALAAGAPAAAWARSFAPIHRQNVELKLTIKPQINESDYIRLVINEQTEEIASHGPGARPHHLQAHREDHGGRQGPGDGGHRRHHAGPHHRVGHQGARSSATSRCSATSSASSTRQKMKTNLLLFLTPVHHPGPERLPPHLRAQDEGAAAVRGAVLRRRCRATTWRSTSAASRARWRSMNQAVLREEQKAGERRPGHAGRARHQARGQRPPTPAAGQRPRPPARGRRAPPAASRRRPPDARAADAASGEAPPPPALRGQRPRRAPSGCASSRPARGSRSRP